MEVRLLFVYPPSLTITNLTLTYPLLRIACFNIKTGDIEDAPAPDALNKFDIYEKDSAVYVKSDVVTLKRYGRHPINQCNVVSDDRIVIIGGYVIEPKDGSKYLC